MNKDGTLSVAEKKELNDLIEAVRATVTALNEFRQEVADEARAFLDEKSENWQEGEKGQAYTEWAETWENAVDYGDTDGIEDYCPVEPG